MCIRDSLDIVAVKIDQGRDYKIGIVVDTSQPTRVKVRLFTNGKQSEPSYHPLTLGLLYRDPPQQSSEEIQLNNEATERARVGITKAWKGSEDEVKEAERKILQKQYANMVVPGQHKGGTNLLTGRTDSYFVTDLPSKHDLTNESNFMSSDNECLRQAYSQMKAASSPRLSRKINVYIDRFLYMLSSIVPASKEKDIDAR